MLELKKTLTPWRIGVFTLALVWVGAHYAGVQYGTKDLPLHFTYVGDEQAPVYGALHMLQAGSPLGLRDERALYYGPLLATAALPGIVADAGFRFVVGRVQNVEEYKNLVMFDWGGIARNNRMVMVLVSLFGLFVAYHIFRHPIINPSQNRNLALLATALLGVNYYYFEYSHFFRHWQFVVVAFLVQMYVALEMSRTNGEKAWHWWVHGAMTVLIFGVSYVGVLLEIAFLPLAYRLWKRSKDAVKRSVVYVLLSVACFVLIALWHPYGVERYLGFLGIGELAGKLGGLDNVTNPFDGGPSSFNFYSGLMTINYLPIWIALLLMAHWFRRVWRASYLQWLWFFAVAPIVHFVFFAFAEHHEARYILPTIILFIVGATALLVRYLHEPFRTKTLTHGVVALFALYGACHFVHVITWITFWGQGPAEEQVIQEALALQEGSETPVLILQGGIAGHPHTPEAYRTFARQRGKEDYNIYKELTSRTPPSYITLLNAHYMHPDEFALDPVGVAEGYEHIILNVDEAWRRVEPFHPFDYVDRNMVRIWYDEVKPPVVLK